MYKEMGVTDPLPLDKLSKANPNLYVQIQQDAERIVSEATGRPVRPAVRPGRVPPAGKGPSRPVGSPGESNATGDQFVKGFIAQSLVNINLSEARRVNERLQSWKDVEALPEESRDPRLVALRQASLAASARLSKLLGQLDNPAPIPRVVFGLFALYSYQPFCRLRLFHSTIRIGGKGDCLRPAAASSCYCGPYCGPFAGAEPVHCGGKYSELAASGGSYP
jgi:hypothetical protein